MEMKYKRYCLVCGKLIPKKTESWARYKLKKFCSNKCQTSTFRTQRLCGKCIICGDIFEYRKGQQTGNFCSQECFNKYQDKKVEMKCDWCGKDIKVKRVYLKRHKYHFCSPECQIKWQQSKKARHICPICGSIFYTPQSGRRTTCSEKCKGILSCRIQSQRRISKLELTGRKLLEEIGLVKDKDFVEQFIINGKLLVDVFILNKNLIIQWDGDYWHNLPKVKARDLAQNNYLTKCGYKVLRFWEHEVKNNPDKVKERIYEEISSEN